MNAMRRLNIAITLVAAALFVASLRVMGVEQIVLGMGGDRDPGPARARRLRAPPPSSTPPTRAPTPLSSPGATR